MTAFVACFVLVLPNAVCSAVATRSSHRGGVRWPP
jgi:hypothetical protein